MYFILPMSDTPEELTVLAESENAAAPDAGVVFHGAVTVGERGQVVIPANARREIGIEPGERLLFFHHSRGGMLMLMKIDAFQQFLNQQLKVLEQARLAWDTSPDRADVTPGSSDPE